MLFLYREMFHYCKFGIVDNLFVSSFVAYWFRNLSYLLTSDYACFLKKWKKCYRYILFVCNSILILCSNEVGIYLFPVAHHICPTEIFMKMKKKTVTDKQRSFVSILSQNLTT